MGKNVIIFVADMSSSVHIDNKEKDILIVGEGPTQRLDDTTLIAEAIYPSSFTQSNKRFVFDFIGKNITCKTQNFYILFPFSLINKALLIVVSIHCYWMKY